MIDWVNSTLDGENVFKKNNWTKSPILSQQQQKKTEIKIDLC